MRCPCTTENNNQQSDKYDKKNILTHNHDKKYNSMKHLKGEQFSFTKTCIESEVFLKILSHEQNLADLSLTFNPASPCLLFFKMNCRQEYRPKLSFYNQKVN